jgi:hypothetical protein
MLFWGNRFEKGFKCFYLFYNFINYIMSTFQFSSLYVGQLKLAHLVGVVDETLFVITPTDAALMGDAGVKTRANLQANATAIKAAMDKPQSSLVTPQISAANDACDSTFQEVKRMVKTARKSTVPAKAAASEVLLHFLNSFWKLDTHPIPTQTALTNELLLRYNASESLKNAAQEIGTSDLFVVLASQNQTLEELLHARLNEHSVIMPAASTFKGVVTEEYRCLCTLVVNNLNVDAPPAELIPVFHKMDDIRKKYSTLIPTKPDLKNAVTEPIATQTYTGKAITPIPVASYSGKELVFAKDFAVSYKGNVEVGEAVAILHGKGKFTGVHERRFNIVEI